MMISLEYWYGVILLILNLVFLTIVSYSDLKTSLIDVRVVGFFDVLGFILHIIFGYLLKKWTYLFYAIGFFVLFLVLGYGLYYLSKWGEGDALVLGSMYFLYPYPFFVPFHIVIGSRLIYYVYVLFFNVAVWGIIYSLLYAFIVSLKNDNKGFYKKLKGKISFRDVFISFIIGFFMALPFYLFNKSLWYFILPFVVVFFYFLYVFAKLSDEILFTKKIPLRDVKEGDTVIGEFAKANFKGTRLDAITQEEINNLISAYGPNKEVEIKDMVRYIPSFLIGFVFTILFGDLLLYYILKLL